MATRARSSLCPERDCLAGLGCDLAAKTRAWCGQSKHAKVTGNSIAGPHIRALRRKFPPIVKKTGEIHGIVETPQGSRNKFTFEPQAQVFQLGFAMPAGFEFPFEFAFVPGTLGEDGDPLDLLVLMDAPRFVGCLCKMSIGWSHQSSPKDEGRHRRAERSAYCSTRGIATPSENSLSGGASRRVAPRNGTFSCIL